MSEWNASEYNRHSQLQATLAQEQIGRLTLQGNERVLDVGCGDGKVTAEFAARVPHGSVLGVDPSANMIAFATSHFPPATNPNLRFEVADVRHLPYRQEFERAISFNALHWVPEQAAALRSIRAALIDGGQAFLQFVPAGKLKGLEVVLEEVRLSTKWANYFGSFKTPFVHFTPEEYQDLATQNGFRVLSMVMEDRSWDFHTREEFAAFGRATFVEWLRHIPESMWPEFISEVLDRYRTVAADNPQEANTFKFYQLEVTLEAA